MKWLLITFLAIIAIYAQQPVPALTDGYVMGDPSAPRTLEMFVDFEVSDYNRQPLTPVSRQCRRMACGQTSRAKVRRKDEFACPRVPTPLRKST